MTDPSTTSSSPPINTRQLRAQIAILRPDSLRDAVLGLCLELDQTRRQRDEARAGSGPLGGGLGVVDPVAVAEAAVRLGFPSGSVAEFTRVMGELGLAGPVPVVTAEAVERAARKLAEQYGDEYGSNFETAPNNWRTMARYALDAALSVPVSGDAGAEAVEARRLSVEVEDLDLLTITGPPGTPNTGEWVRRADVLRVIASAAPAVSGDAAGLGLFIDPAADPADLIGKRVPGEVNGNAASFVVADARRDEDGRMLVRLAPAVSGDTGTAEEAHPLDVHSGGWPARVNVPHVPNGPDGIEPVVADATYYREAARNIRYAWEHGSAHFAGSTLTEAVAALCDAAADGLSDYHRSAAPAGEEA